MKNYLFDFDYTLADSSKGAIECITHALSKLGKSIPDKEVITQTIGLSLNDTLKFLSKKTTVEDEKLFAQYFVEKADEVMTDLTVLFDSVSSTINKLSNAECKLGIVSTKFRYRIEEILARENLLSFFDIIIGGEDVINHKPSEEGLLKAIKSLNLNKKDIFYIGDSIVDAETALNADVQFIASLTGVTKKEDFQSFSVNSFITNLKELY